MIPLVRPVIPALDELIPFLRASERVGQFSNFGPCFHSAVQRLKDVTERYVLPVSNGTTAIAVALRSILPVGARVAVPDYTFVGTLQAVFEGHFRAVILPSNPETWALDPMALQRYRNKIDAAIVVSPFGYFVDTKFYDELATRLGISLVYDFAGAWGMWPRTRFPVTYSLHATKNFSCGEGGLVSYAENQEWDAGFRLHNFGFDNQGKPGILLAGNHKIDEFRAAQILAHLAKHDRILDRIEAKRRAISAYQSRLNAKPVALHNNGAPSLCVLSGLDARKIEKESARLGFKAKQYYPLLTSVPTFNKVERHGRVQECFGTHIALPSDVTAHEIDLISEQVLSLG